MERYRNEKVGKVFRAYVEQLGRTLQVFQMLSDVVNDEFEETHSVGLEDLSFAVYVIKTESELTSALEDANSLLEINYFRDAKDVAQEQNDGSSDELEGEASRGSRSEGQDALGETL